jgi:hypothetical protein
MHTLSWSLDTDEFSFLVLSLSWVTEKLDRRFRSYRDMGPTVPFYFILFSTIVSAACSPKWIASLLCAALLSLKLIFPGRYSWTVNVSLTYSHVLPLFKSLPAFPRSYISAPWRWLIWGLRRSYSGSYKGISVGLVWRMIIFMLGKMVSILVYWL